MLGNETKDNTAPLFNALDVVFTHKSKEQGLIPVTTSLLVAEYFGKEHKNVLQSIQKLDCSEEFSQLNFQPSKRKDERGKYQPIVLMTRDGFMFLAMGFRGKKAAQFKEAFISRFNYMENWIADRTALKDHQPLLHEAIQFIESKTGKRDEHAHSRENNLVYCVALGHSRKKWLQINDYPADDDIRQHLTAQQLKLIDRLISENAMMIKLDMSYQDRKAKLQESALYYWQKHAHRLN